VLILICDVVILISGVVRYHIILDGLIDAVIFLAVQCKT
jgi:hypothetical protein